MKAAGHGKPPGRTRSTRVLRALVIPLAMLWSTASCTHAAVVGSLAALQSLAPAARQAFTLGALALAEGPDESGRGSRRRSGASRAKQRAQRDGDRRGTADDAGAASDREGGDDGDGDAVAEDTDDGAGTATTRAKRNAGRRAGRDLDPDDDGDPDRDATGSGSSRTSGRSPGGTRQEPFRTGKAGKRASGSRGRGTGITVTITEDAEDVDDVDDAEDAAGADDIGSTSDAAAMTDERVPRQTRSNLRLAAPGQSHSNPARPERVRAAMPDRDPAVQLHRRKPRPRDPCLAPELSARLRAACRRRDRRDS